ncbi:hypothetical protein [Pseudomonas frederiksbergensis]|uniref:hypothetical protein n=1 Tax=Pseudomonas frederiksbergensis TaxID=104087 RepID=UPI003D1CFC86
MNIDDEETGLGRIRIMGQRDPHDGYKDQVLWVLTGYAPRMPPTKSSFAVDGSPGSHALRTLQLRAESRYIRYSLDDDTTNLNRFMDPLLLDLSLSANDLGGGVLNLHLFGAEAQVRLTRETRALLSPLWEHPDHRTPGENETQKNVVPAYLLQGASLQVDAQSMKPVNFLPGFDSSGSVELTPEGVVYTAKILPPDGSAQILTRVKLERKEGRARIVFMNPQPAQAQADWRQVWQRLNAIAETTRSTAWARFAFVIDTELPVLIWSAERKGNVIDAKWDAFVLPEGVAQLTLADQPIESQMLPPAQVLQLMRQVSMTRQNGKLVVSTSGTAPKGAVGRYTWDGKDESIGFGTTALVHDADGVRTQLFALYEREKSDKATAIGFMKLDDGWAEVPFDSDPGGKLPAPVKPQDAKDVKGSFWLGNRRHEFFGEGKVPLFAPWSVQIDEPGNYSATLTFVLESTSNTGVTTPCFLQSAEIVLADFAMTVRGMAWLAATRPDGHDALPHARDEPDAYFDVLLRNCTGKLAQVPFTLGPLNIVAPKRPASGWDTSSRRDTLQPVLTTGLLTLNPRITAPGRASQRVWLRHATLPSVQVMAITRSDPSSNRPHASRALSPFDRPSAPLELEAPASMAPKLSAVTRATFSAVGVAGLDQHGKPIGTPLVPLAALTLPGFELEPVSPEDYRVKGAYTLPLWDELHARATLPPPEDALLKPPLPVVSALDEAALARLMRENLHLRAHAGTQDSLMFPATTMHTAVPVQAQGLYPPLEWKAKVKVDDQVVIGADSKVRIGAASFEDGAWNWEATGNHLLEGPPQARLFIEDKQCRVGDKGDAELVGWSVQERVLTLDNGKTVFIRDGRGVMWARELVVSARLVARQIQRAGHPQDAFWLLGTNVPIRVHGLRGVEWQFAFTDVPVSHTTRRMATPTGLAQQAGQAWSWSLSEPRSDQDLVIEPLALGPCLRFVPTALKDIVWSADGQSITEVIVEGSLVLGTDNPAVSGDTLRRVEISMTSSGAGSLAITGVSALGKGQTITWGLDLESADRVFSGAPQLTGKLGIDGDVLRLYGARLLARLFTSDCDVALDDVNLFDTKMTFSVSDEPPSLKVLVTTLVVNLASARVYRVELKTVLRKGVTCTILHERSSDAAGTTTATLAWFGNRIEWEADLDPARRSCVFTGKAGNGPLVSVFAGRQAASFRDGILCLGFAPDESGGLVVRTHFLELLLDDGALQLTHMLSSGGRPQERDILRLDGVWKQQSLVAWPKLEGVDFNLTADGQYVDFNAPEQIVHEAEFVLLDHCLDGAGFELAASGKGIRPSMADVSQTSSWLVETTHRFKWAIDSAIEVRSISTLQFWSPTALATELKAMWEQRKKQEGEGEGKKFEGFGFVPGYIGRSPTQQFLRPGVRRIDQGYAGLFNEQVVQALGKEPKDAWIMLGGMTAMCLDEVASEADTTPRQLLLHLPFVAALGAGGSLESSLKVIGPLNTKIHMARHDILATRIRTDALLAVSLGDLIATPLRRELSFARDLQPSGTTGGASLAQNWFGHGDEAILTGWHVEQLQPPGPTPPSTKVPAPLPFPYPRAAVMLAALLEASSEQGKMQWQALSILTRIARRGGKEEGVAKAMNVEVRAIRLQPGLSKNKGATSSTRRSDLIIGGPSGVIAVPLSAADEAVEDPKHLIGLAIAHLAEPVFVVRRSVDTSIFYSNFPLPARDRDPLEFALRPLWAKAGHAPDGRLTWPVPEGVEKVKAVVQARARAPRHYQAPLTMAGVTGGIDTALLMGKPFGLNATVTVGVTDTVWVQEWVHVAYAFMPDQRDDAAPWMRDVSVARPLVPSTREISRALLRMDPVLANGKERMIQTWLPAAADSIDFASRAGAFVSMGVRGMRSVNAVHRQFEPAAAGPATTRTLRRPRPVALPENGENARAWRRTVAWYGMVDRTCMAIAGAWDSMSSPLSDRNSEIPPWCLFVGKPMPYGLVEESRGMPPVWRGAVVVQCIVLCRDNYAMLRPAHVVLGMLVIAHQQNNLRCSLRVGSRMIDFEKVELLNENGVVSNDKLVFSLGGAEKITEGDCTFECGFIPLSTPAETTTAITIGKPPPRETLDPVELRTIVLPVRGPVQGRYPVPVLRRTVFFADPAFDRRLSRVKPISANALANPDKPKEPFNAWIDRPCVTPDETVVVRVKAAKKQPATYDLTAKVSYREGGPPEELLFQLVAGAVPMASVPLTLNAFYALPTSTLRTRANRVLRPGDTLVLEVWSDVKDRPPARLTVPVRERSSLPPPQAMYSLITTDPSRPAAWCSAHSQLPAPESMCTEVLDAATDRLLRRASFKWLSYEPHTDKPLFYSIIRAEKATQSMHIPEAIEQEYVPKN